MRSLGRFPFVLAALVVIVLAGFALFGDASREFGANDPTTDPWGPVPAATKRVPATPSRGAMGIDPTAEAPRRVSARIAP